MPLSRRDFVRAGTAFAVGVAAEGFLPRVARAQALRSRTLVILDLLGGNDSLSLLIPYNDPFYGSRRPTIAVAPGQVLQAGSDASGRALGLHPRLGGLHSLFDEGRLALVQRVGYPSSSRSHFLGTDIWSTANPDASTGPGWLGRYLDSLRGPIDPLTAWSTAGDVPHTLRAAIAPVASVPSASAYTYQTAGTGSEGAAERTAATRLAGNPSPDRPLLAFANDSIRSALQTVDRVATVASYAPSVAYPVSGLGQALRTVAGAMVRGTGTQIFFVQTGGYDTHAGQGVVETTGTYWGLMAALNDALAAFAADLKNRGLFNDTLLLQFSEFGRRIAENGSRGTDHGAAGVMMALGGRVRGGLHGTAPDLNPYPQNPTLENNGADVRHAIDFRSVYAAVLDNWLGADSVALLGGDFRRGAPAIL
jgi:uncharacterized protein (DUF1501 family)